MTLEEKVLNRVKKAMMGKTSRTDPLGSWKMVQDLKSLSSLDSNDITLLNLRDIGKAIEILAKEIQQLKDRHPAGPEGYGD